MARSAAYRQTDKTREKEFTEGWTFTAIMPCRYSGRFYLRLSGTHWQEVPHVQTDRQNQGERIHRAMDLHSNYPFVDIQVDSISDSAEYIGKKYPKYRQTDKTREKEPSQSDGPSRLLRLRRYTGRFYLRLSRIHWQEVPHIQPGRQNQGERIHRAMGIHGYNIFVDIQVDSISDSAEYIGKKYPIYRQTDKTREKEFTERWTFTAINRS